MALKYYLIKNSVSRNPTAQRAISVPDKVYNLEDLIDEMIRHGSTVTKAEALSVIEEFFQSIEKVIAEGSALSIPLFSISSKISGVFSSDEERFSASRHKLKTVFKPGHRLTVLLDKISVEKVKSQARRPRLRSFRDGRSGLNDTLITPGGFGWIMGEWLKFNPADLQQGIFFIHKGTAAVTRVSSQILENNPGKLAFEIPMLEPGLYNIQVCTILRHASILRRSTLPFELPVK